MFEYNIEAVARQCAGKFIGPFNGRNGRLIEILTETDCEDLRFGVQSVEVCMDEGQTAIVFVNENESGAGNSGWFGIKAFRYAANKSGLSRTECSAQSENFPSRHGLADQTSQSGGILNRTEDKSPLTWRPLTCMPPPVSVTVRSGWLTRESVAKVLGGCAQ